MKLTKGMKKALSLLLSAAMVVTGVNVTANTASAADDDTTKVASHEIVVTGATEAGQVGGITLDGSSENIKDSNAAIIKAYCNTWEKDGDGNPRNTTCLHPMGTLRDDITKYKAPKLKVVDITEGKKINIYSSMDGWNGYLTKQTYGKGDTVDLSQLVATDEWKAKVTDEKTNTESYDPNAFQISVPFGASATFKLYDAAEEGYNVDLMIKDANWGEPKLDKPVYVDGNGTYTLSISGEIAQGKPNVFCIDIQGITAAKNLNADDISFSDVKVVCDGEEYPTDISKMFEGAIEADKTDNYRLELCNQWGWNGGVTYSEYFDPDEDGKFGCSENLTVTFTVKGIKEGTTDRTKFGTKGSAIVAGTYVEGTRVNQEPVSPSPSADASASPSADVSASPAGGATTTPGNTKTTSGSGITTTTKPAVSATPQAVGTSKITPKQKLVVVAPGKSVKVAFTAKAAAPATKAAVVTASTSAKKVVTAKVSGKKVTIKAPKKAVKGSSATVTLKSTNGDKKVSAKIKVYVRNSAKKVKAAKKSITVKKNKTTKLVIKASKVQNKKKAFADKITVKGKILKLTNVKYAKGKATLTLKGVKKAKKKAVTIKVGKKSVKIKATVK